jgi:hypothetical protein
MSMFLRLSADGHGLAGYVDPLPYSIIAHEHTHTAHLRFRSLRTGDSVKISLTREGLLTLRDACTRALDMMDDGPGWTAEEQMDEWTALRDKAPQAWIVNALVILAWDQHLARMAHAPLDTKRALSADAEIRRLDRERRA